MGSPNLGMDLLGEGSLTLRLSLGDSGPLTCPQAMALLSQCKNERSKPKDPHPHFYLHCTPSHPLTHYTISTVYSFSKSKHDES